MMARAEGKRVRAARRFARTCVWMRNAAGGLRPALSVSGGGLGRVVAAGVSVTFAAFALNASPTHIAADARVCSEKMKKTMIYTLKYKIRKRVNHGGEG